MLDGLRQDVRIGVRGLARSPGFAAAALVTLAMGIGASSAIFSVVKAVLLTPLPYEQPERRVQIFSRWISFDKTWLSDQEVVDYRNMAKTLSGVAAWGTGPQNLTGDGEPVRVNVGFVMADLFDVLGARPLIGRSFTADEDRPGGAPVAVLGYALWQSRYGGDPAVVGRRLLIDDTPVEVVGVMPRGFRLPTDYTDEAADPTALWRPLQLDMKDLQRGNHGYFAAATLAPEQTAATATEELRSITRRLTEQGFYSTAMQFSAFAVPLDQEIRGGVRPAMWLLVGAVSCLVLIGCANVANLLLVRGDARLREMAVRTALGAAPGRIARQLFTESLVLASGGALLGLGLAIGALRALVAIDPTSLPPLAPVTVDSTVVAFTLALGVATTLFFGLVPALHARRVNLLEPLREGGHQASSGGARLRARSLLVAAEIALAVVLVIGAGLMLRSLSALGRIDLGFDPEHLLTLRVSVPDARYDTPERVVGFYRQLNERVRALAGVEAAGVVRALPLATTIGDWGLDVDGYVEAPGRNAKGDWQIASDGAFEAMGTRLVRGRWFTPADRSDTQLVAVVNETLARTYWSDPEAVVGGRIRVGNPRNPWLLVVGVVADERHNGVTGRVKEKFYVPHSQWHLATGGNLVRNAFVVVRTAGDPLALAGPVRRAVHDLDPNLPVADIRPMTEIVATSLATPRLTGFLLGIFALMAFTLAAVGIYGVLSYVVGRRTHEIGIRMAMGASRSQVVRLVLLQAVRMAGAGVAGGLLLAFGLTRLMQSLLYEVRPMDPLTFVSVAAALVLVAVAAGAVPAWRATRVSPLLALKSE